MSAFSLVAAYLRQRARLRLLVPLSILLAVAGRLFVAPADATAATVIAACQALAFILAFRIWDDLEDRELDRVRHPERVAVSAPTTRPLKLMGLALACGAMIPLFLSPFALWHLAAVSLAAAIVAFWYGARADGPRRHTLGEHVLATKYPLIAYAIAPELPNELVTPRVVVILAVLYAVICVYEYADDVELRQIFTSRRSVP
jgi:4-hydroxybenzoate polyprenyltransferase